MSVQITGNTLHLPDKGMVVMDAMLVLYDAARHKPAIGTAVWLVLETVEGDLCWELGEWREGEMWPAGWFLVGIDTPIAEKDYTVRFWCEEPSLAYLAAAQADGGRAA